MARRATSLKALFWAESLGAVATAMQRYGGYVMDVAATPLSMSFERDGSAGPKGVGQTYEAAGFRWDYDAMEHIPWEKLRVLSS